MYSSIIGVVLFGGFMGDGVRGEAWSLDLQDHLT